MNDVLAMPLDRVAEGAELAADLEDARGQVLLKQGTRLSGETLRALRRRGIEHVPIRCAAACDEATLAARRQVITQSVARRFARHEHDALMQTLKAVVLEHRLEVLR